MCFNLRRCHMPCFQFLKEHHRHVIAGLTRDAPARYLLGPFVYLADSGNVFPALPDKSVADVAKESEN